MAVDATYHREYRKRKASGCFVDRRKELLDIAGSRFSRLMAVSVAYQDRLGTYWNCVCDCGNTCVALLTKLRLGRKTSCGCAKKQRLLLGPKSIVTHGHARRKVVDKIHKGTYETWVNMKSRCTNPNSPVYSYYGGRGVTVCDRWLSSFENFLADMGERPTGLTIDRVNPFGNYEPSNCRWATRSEQSHNQRRYYKGMA